MGFLVPQALYTLQAFDRAIQISGYPARTAVFAGNNILDKFSDSEKGDILNFRPNVLVQGDPEYARLARP